MHSSSFLSVSWTCTLTVLLVLQNTSYIDGSLMNDHCLWWFQMPFVLVPVTIWCRIWQGVFKEWCCCGWWRYPGRCVLVYLRIYIMHVERLILAYQKEGWQKKWGMERRRKRGRGMGQEVKGPRLREKIRWGGFENDTRHREKRIEEHQFWWL